jgi:hypothetical protein
MRELQATGHSRLATSTSRGKTCRRAVTLSALVGLLATGVALQSPAAYAGLSNCASNVPMYTRDDGWSPHNKYVGMYVPTDVTDRYKQGKAYITYDQGSDHFRFDRSTSNPFLMEPRGLNLWGVSTGWAATHWNWRTTNSWRAHYN